MGKKRRLINSQKFSSKHDSHPILGGSQISEITVAATPITQPDPVVIEMQPSPVATPAPSTKTEATAATTTASAETVAKIQNQAPAKTMIKAAKSTKTTTAKNVPKNTVKSSKKAETTRPTVRKTKSSANKSS